MRVIAILLATLTLMAPAPPAQKLKVHISVDMEGVVGTVTGDQLGPTGFEYGRFRDFMTREALAAVNAARAAGATDIIVTDAHGNGENLLIEQFPADVRIIRSWPRQLGMVAGADQADVVMFIGYHASTNNVKGVRAHTFSSANLTRVALNGVNVSEGSWAAAIAGHFNAPVIMMSGDDAAIAEVRKAIGNVEAAETKRSLGFHSAVTITPGASTYLIAQRIAAACEAESCDPRSVKRVCLPFPGLIARASSLPGSTQGESVPIASTLWKLSKEGTGAKTA